MNKFELIDDDEGSSSSRKRAKAVDAVQHEASVFHKVLVLFSQ